MPFQQEREHHSLSLLGPEHTPAGVWAVGAALSWPSGAESCWGYHLLCWGSAFWLLLFLRKVMGESWHGDDTVQAQCSAAPLVLGKGCFLTDVKWSWG